MHCVLAPINRVCQCDQQAHWSLSPFLFQHLPASVPLWQTTSLTLLSASYSESVLTTASLEVLRNFSPLPFCPGDGVLFKELQVRSLEPKWLGPRMVILTMPAAQNH